MCRSRCPADTKPSRRQSPERPGSPAPAPISRTRETKARSGARCLLTYVPLRDLGPTVEARPESWRNSNRTELQRIVFRKIRQEEGSEARIHWRPSPNQINRAWGVPGCLALGVVSPLSSAVALRRALYFFRREGLCVISAHRCRATFRALFQRTVFQT